MATASHRQALERYWRRVARVIGVEGWVLTVSEEEPPDGADAATYILNNENTARLHVPARFWSMTPDAQRVLVAHEALHLLFDRPLLDFAAAVKKALPEYLVDAMEEIATREQERSIETFARTIAHNLPESPASITTARPGAAPPSEAGETVQDS